MLEQRYSRPPKSTLELEKNEIWKKNVINETKKLLEAGGVNYSEEIAYVDTDSNGFATFNITIGTTETTILVPTLDKTILQIANELKKTIIKKLRGDWTKANKTAEALAKLDKKKLNKDTILKALNLK